MSHAAIPSDTGRAFQAAGSSRQTLTTLQAGRAIAAIAVVAFHAHVFFIPERLYPDQSVSRVFNFGYAGVEFFFVLSGFIMAFVHGPDIGRPDRAAAFLRRRVTRILPFYWVVLLLLVGLLLLQWPGSADRLTVPNIVHSFLLLPKPDGSPFLITAAWTLSHEFLFYAVFAVLILRPRLGAALFLVWILGALAVSLGVTPGYPVDFLLSPFNLLFPMGILAANLFRRLTARAAAALAIGGAVLFLAVGLAEVYAVIDWNHALRTILFGLGATGMVSGLAALEGQGRLRAPRLLDFLGDASYAIYLVHGIVLPVLAKVLVAAGVNSLVPAWLALAVLIGVSTVAGAVMHVYVEKPLIARLRKRQRQRAAA